MPTPVIEPISECELEAGRPRYQVARFQMMAAPRSDSTIASTRPVLAPRIATEASCPRTNGPGAA